MTSLECYFKNMFHCGQNMGDNDNWANFIGADLRRANLIGADLHEAKYVPYIPMACPDEGSFIGWKKARRGLIVKLLIPEDSKRSSGTSRKCRCDKEVLW